MCYRKCDAANPPQWLHVSVTYTRYFVPKSVDIPLLSCHVSVLVDFSSSFSRCTPVATTSRNPVVKSWLALVHTDVCVPIVEKNTKGRAAPTSLTFQVYRFVVGCATKIGITARRDASSKA